MKQIFDPVRLVRGYVSQHPVLKPFLALGVVSTVGFAILVVTGQLNWRIALFVVFFNVNDTWDIYT